MTKSQKSIFKLLILGVVIVIASSPLIDGNDKIYEAYLESNPELKFYIKSECSYVMEHSIYTRPCLKNDTA